jgi:hypothetical protein
MNSKLFCLLICVCIPGDQTLSVHFHVGVGLFLWFILRNCLDTARIDGKLFIIPFCQQKSSCSTLQLMNTVLLLTLILSEKGAWKLFKKSEKHVYFKKTIWCLWIVYSMHVAMHWQLITTKHDNPRVKTPFFPITVEHLSYLTQVI